jgi:hypothetical protein
MEVEKREKCVSSDYNWVGSAATTSCSAEVRFDARSGTVRSVR